MDNLERAKDENLIKSRQHEQVVNEENLSINDNKTNNDYGTDINV